MLKTPHFKKLEQANKDSRQSYIHNITYVHASSNKHV